MLTLGNFPRSGDFDMPLSNRLCFSTQPTHGVVGMLWIGTLLIGSCITIAFLKRWNIYKVIAKKCISGIFLLIHVWVPSSASSVLSMNIELDL